MENCIDEALASRLKSACNEDGKEVDKCSTAEVFHSIGKIYENKCPCQMHFILSAVFFNAAISRQPNNHEFLKSLQNLCSKLLQACNAVNSSTDLLSKSYKTLEQVKKMRQFTKNELEELPRLPTDGSSEKMRSWERKMIKFFKRLQRKLNRKYKKIFVDLTNTCIEILGDPPCKYAIIGRGSLARESVTPFSSFKYMIALEEGIRKKDIYRGVLNYFYWYDTLLRVLLVNLKETVVTSSYISDLNIGGNCFVDTHTLSGISFDENAPRTYCISRACTECSFREIRKSNIIGPISVLLQWLKGESTPCDALLNVCQISGYDSVYKHFTNEVKTLLSQEEIKDNFIHLSPMSDAEILSYSSYADIKHLFYNKAVVLISLNGNMLSVHFSPFKIVDTLKEQKIIEEEQAHRLSFNVALAFEMRLKTYHTQKSYKNKVGKRNYKFRDRNALNWIIKRILETSLADFFCTAHALHLAYEQAQCDYNLQTCFKKVESEANLLDRFKILKYLNIQTIFLSEWRNCPAFGKNLTPENLSIRHILAEMNLDNSHLNVALQEFSSLSEQTSSDSIKAKAEVGKLFCYCRQKEYIKALQHAKSNILSVSVEQQASASPRNFCSGESNDVESAGPLSNRALKLNGCSYDCLRCLEPREKFLLLSKIAFETGNCEFQIKRYKNAIKEFQVSIQCLENYGFDPETNDLLLPRYFCQNWFYIGQSHYQLKEFSKARRCLNNALDVSCPNDFVEVELSLILDCHDLLGKCYAQLKKPDMTLDCLEKQVHVVRKNPSVSKNVPKALQEKIRQFFLKFPEHTTNAFHLHATILKYVKVWDLSNQKLASKEAALLGKNLEELSAPIDKLILSNNCIKDKGAKAIAIGMHMITTLDMSNCGISSAGAVTIGETITTIPHKIKELNLSENILKDAGITGICKGIRKIEKLKVSYCCITGKGAGTLGKSLRNLTSAMKELDLRGNKIGDEGAKSLAIGAHNVRDLKLNACNITDEGANALKKEKLICQKTRIHGEAFSCDNDSKSSSDED